MRYKNIKIISIFALCWLSFAGFFLYSDAFDSLILWILLPLMYLPLVYFSWRTNYFVLTLFVLATTTTNAFTPAYFFLNRDEYSSWGWNSVNKFEFMVSNYLYINNYLLFFLIVVIISSLFISKFLFRTPTYKKALFKVASLVKSY